MNRKQIEKKAKHHLEKSWTKKDIIDDIVRYMTVSELKAFIRGRGGGL